MMLVFRFSLGACSRQARDSLWLFAGNKRCNQWMERLCR
jgi:hypothetical protein